MTLQDLIARFRVLAADKAQPPLWSDAEVTMWLNDAQRQACIRGRLIREDENKAVCLISMQEGKQTYKLHPKVYEIINLRFVGASRARPAVIVSREWLDNERPSWRDDNYPPELVIQDDTTIRIVGSAVVGEVLQLECYRLPLEDMVQGDDEPEIHEAHHEHLVQWALHKAFSVVDADGFDARRSAQAEDEFTRYFGLMPDADLRRKTREDVIHHNYGYLA